MFLDHVDSFGKFFRFFVHKHFLLSLKKEARTMFLPLSQQNSSFWMSLAKIV